MADTRNLVVLMTRGTDHELSSVGFTIACGGLTAGLKVSVFLTSASVDLVRKRALETTVVPPLSPLRELVQDFMKRGGTVYGGKTYGAPPTPAQHVTPPNVPPPGQSPRGTTYGSPPQAPPPQASAYPPRPSQVASPRSGSIS